MKTTKTESHSEPLTGLEHCVGPASIELTETLPSLSLSCWPYRNVPPCTVKKKDLLKFQKAQERAQGY